MNQYDQLKKEYQLVYWLFFTTGYHARRHVISADLCAFLNNSGNYINRSNHNGSNHSRTI